MNLSIKQIFKEGYNLVRKNLKFVVLFWCTNAAMAIVLSMPIFSMLYDNLHKSILSESLTNQINFLWFSQFMHIYSGTISKLPLLIYGIVGLYAIVQTFYFGGLVSIFSNRSKNHISDFFYGGVRYWYSFIKVLLISLIFYALAFKFYDLIGDALTWLFRQSEYYLADFILRSILYLILLVLIGLVTIISDYTKVSVAIDSSPKILKAIPNSLYFLKSNYRISFTVFLVIAVLGGTGALVYNIIDTFIPRSPLYFLALSFIIQQMLIIFRLLIRMFFCATEVIIYSDLKAEVLEPRVKESEVGVK